MIINTRLCPICGRYNNTVSSYCINDCRDAEGNKAKLDANIIPSSVVILPSWWGLREQKSRELKVFYVYFDHTDHYSPPDTSPKWHNAIKILEEGELTTKKK